MNDEKLEIRLLETAEQMAPIVTMFQQVWGSVIPIVGVELLRAIGHGGGYVAGAFDSGHIVGASFGFLARHDGDDALHSHVTGILPGVQRSGVGRAMKNHQRAWAADQGLKWITWTFDPLVRRNAWFNIEVLRAHVADYLIDFYGPMTDSINGQDESDRLMVAWLTDPTAAVDETIPDVEAIEVPTPEDIVVIRRTDRDAARDWRLRVREELGERMNRGAVVTGFTRDGAYIVYSPGSGEAAIKRAANKQGGAAIEKGEVS
jgi:predicted GNAT superfamily acetyltransferase